MVSFVNYLTPLCFIIVCFLPASLGTDYGLKRICYFTNWAQYRPSPATYGVEQIQASLCSHLIFAFAVLGEDNKIKAFEWNDESEPGRVGTFEKIIELKRRKPWLTVQLAIGGWEAGTEQMSKMLATYNSRKVFINDAIKFLRSRGFDGIDLDFEYPAMRGSPPGDKFKFTALCMEMKYAFGRDKSGPKRLLLSAAVGAGKETIDTAYEPAALAESLDFFNLMSYDLHGSWEDVTGHHSPLYSRRGEKNGNEFLNMKYAAEYWVEKGVPALKINIGLAAYARGFTLKDESSHGIGAAAISGSPEGPYTKTVGILSHYEICDKLSSPNAIQAWSNQQKIPYLHMDNEWYGYETRESIKYKVEWLRRHKFGGWFIWSIDMDDFTGSHCQTGPYPLLRALNDASFKRIPADAKDHEEAVPILTKPPPAKTTPEVTPEKTTTPPPTTTTTVATTTPDDEPDFPPPEEYVRICNYPNTAPLRYITGKFFMKDIDMSKCSHVVYSSASIRKGFLRPSRFGEKKLIMQFLRLKLKYPKVKLILSIGSVPTLELNKLLTGPIWKRKKFVNNFPVWVKRFDGVLLDFNLKAIHKKKFLNLCKVMKAKLTNKKILAISVPGDVNAINAAYRIPKLRQQAELFIVKGYDLHDWKEMKTGHPSPLFNENGESLSKAMESMVGMGVSRHQLVAGIALHGRGFTILTAKHELGSKSIGPSRPRLISAEVGYIANFEICQMENKSDLVVWLDDMKVPYLKNKQEWFGYENEKSLKIKVKWLVKRGFAGWAVNSIANDDYTGKFCSDGKFPYMTILNNALDD